MKSVLHLEIHTLATPSHRGRGHAWWNLYNTSTTQDQTTMSIFLYLCLCHHQACMTDPPPSSAPTMAPWMCRPEWYQHQLFHSSGLWIFFTIIVIIIMQQLMERSSSSSCTGVPSSHHAWRKYYPCNDGENLYHHQLHTATLRLNEMNMLMQTSVLKNFYIAMHNELPSHTHTHTPCMTDQECSSYTPGSHHHHHHRRDHNPHITMHGGCSQCINIHDKITLRPKGF